MAQTQKFIATGRRKTSVARIRMTPGSGKIDINGRSFEDYFPTAPLQNTVLPPLARRPPILPFRFWRTRRSQKWGDCRSCGRFRRAHRLEQTQFPPRFARPKTLAIIGEDFLADTARLLGLILHLQDVHLRQKR